MEWSAGEPDGTGDRPVDTAHRNELMSRRWPCPHVWSGSLIHIEAVAVFPIVGHRVRGFGARVNGGTSAYQ